MTDPHAPATTPATTATPEKTPEHGSVTAGVKSNVQGQFTANVKLHVEEFQLGELSARIGQLSVFGGDLELKYPVSVGPLQASLSLNYLHWKLPQLGPLLADVVFRGAYEYASNNDWAFGHGAEAKLRLTQVKALDVRIGFDFRVESKNHVETQGWITNISATYRF